MLRPDSFDSLHFFFFHPLCVLRKSIALIPLLVYATSHTFSLSLSLFLIFSRRSYFSRVRELSFPILGTQPVFEGYVMRARIDPAQARTMRLRHVAIAVETFPIFSERTDETDKRASAYRTLFSGGMFLARAPESLVVSRLGEPSCRRSREMHISFPTSSTSPTTLHSRIDSLFFFKLFVSNTAVTVSFSSFLLVRPPRPFIESL